MYEKIKVTVPKRIADTLKKDAEDFGMVKPSGTPNLNALINALVLNYYEDFSAQETELREKIEKALLGMSQKYASDAFRAIIKAVADREKNGEDFEDTVALSFKPTRETEGVFVLIEKVLLKDEALSSFYRRMFISYSQKTKNVREKIIHRRAFEALSKAMKNGVTVCVSLDNGRVYTEASVYSVAPAKDELFNYALMYSDKKNRTIRLSKIRSVTLLLSKSEIPEENARCFERQIASGAQYPMYFTDDEPIKVQLSAKGRELFQKIYLYRPTPTLIEGDVYTFDCSANQALYYFQRFGSEALILSPKRLGIMMRNYYHFAVKKYRSIYGAD